MATIALSRPDAASNYLNCQVEHIEIAGYGTALEFAKMIGDKQSAKLLAQTLDARATLAQQLDLAFNRALDPAFLFGRR